MSKLVEIAGEIVQTQVSRNTMTPEEIAASLREVFRTLQELQKAESAGTLVELPPPIPEAAPEGLGTGKLSRDESIQADKVICLECGAAMKQLTKKHLATHDMGHKDYKRKYGFSMRASLAAKSLSKARSKAAKKRGLPENLKKFIEARRQEKAKASGRSLSDGPGAELAAAGNPKRTKLRKKKG